MLDTPAYSVAASSQSAGLWIQGAGTDMGELRERVAAAAKQRGEREAQHAKLDRWPRYTAWATVAAVIVALGANFLTLWSLKDQEHSAASQNQDSRYSSISQLNIDVDKTIADHPRLISCFLRKQCDAKPALTTQEMDQARALAAYIVDYYQYLYDQLEGLDYVPASGEFIMRESASPAENINDENWITWSETIVEGFQNSNLECAWLVKYYDGYEQQFVHAVAVSGACPGLPDPWA